LRHPAEHALGLAVRDPAILRIEGARLRAEACLVERLQRWRNDIEQATGFLDYQILRTGQVVGEIVGTRMGIERRQDTRSDIVDVDPAEHLIRQVDTARLAFGDTLERAAARPIDPRQAKHPRSEIEPTRIGFGPRRAPTASGQCGFVDPGASRVAVDPGRGQIAEPLAALRQGFAIAFEHRVTFARRDRGEHVARLFQCG